jgi:hypothetical protein
MASLSFTAACAQQIVRASVRLCFRFLVRFVFRNQAIGVTKTTVDIIEICDAYFTV